MTNYRPQPGHRVVATIEGLVENVYYDTDRRVDMVRLKPDTIGAGRVPLAAATWARAVVVPEPKFRKGDRVRFQPSKGSAYAAQPGATATVTADHVADQYLRVQWDRTNVLSRDQHDGGYHAYDFQPAPAAEPIPAPEPAFKVGQQYRNRFSDAVWTRQANGRWTSTARGAFVLSDRDVRHSINPSRVPYPIGELVAPPVFEIGDWYACKKTDCVVTRIADNVWTCTCPDGGRPCDDAAMARWIAVYGDGFSKLEFTDGDVCRTREGFEYKRRDSKWRTDAANLAFPDSAVALNLAKYGGVLNPPKPKTFTVGRTYANTATTWGARPFLRIVGGWQDTETRLVYLDGHREIRDQWLEGLVDVDAVETAVQA